MEIHWGCILAILEPVLDSVEEHWILNHLQETSDTSIGRMRREQRQ